AVEAGTRTRSGRPGARYWQQYARYRLEATLDPSSARLNGVGAITYLNRSPDTLTLVALHLYDNLFAANAVRNRRVPVVGGVELHALAVDGRAMTRRASGGVGAGYEVESSILCVALHEPLLPDDSLERAIGWSLTVPPDGAPRGGTDGELY